MILSRTPLRISFFGGGTDLPVFYNKHEGLVLGTAINKYIYHSVSKFEYPMFDHVLRVNYSNVEHVKSFTDLKHKPFREILRHCQISDGIEVHVISDLPAYTGLGSSSSFTVGLLNALYKYKKINISEYDLAKKAIHIEQKILLEAVGSQDQIFATYGGFNIIRFNKNSFNVENINLSKNIMNELNSSLVLLYTGIKRKAQDIELEKINHIDNIENNLLRIKHYAERAVTFLKEGSLDDFGKLLHMAWIEKKQLSKNVTNEQIDKLYDLAIKSGALGGKLLGAGGGGFFLFYVPISKQINFRNSMSDFHEINFKINSFGSSIIYND